MRIKLKRGFQHNLIQLAKKHNGFTWKELANKLKISKDYLRIDLNYENVLLSQEIYKTLITLININYDKHILNRLKDNWGREKGRKSKKRFKKTKILINNPSVELAELAGIILGDGNIWIKKGGYYYVRICGDSKNDKDYIINYVAPLFESLFAIKPRIAYHNKNREIFLVKGNKEIVFTLKKFGLKEGNKKLNNVGIPSWIFKSNDFLKACIRGLIDTDGSVCPITGRNYPYIWFSSNIPKLRQDFKKAMKLLGFKLSKWNIKKTSQETYIGQKALIEKFFKDIGFSNPKHLKRFQKFHAPVV